jgi:uncharacterized protein YegL
MASQTAEGSASERAVHGERPERNKLKGAMDEMAIPEFGALRRLPVYLLLDTSGSMQGTKIVGLNNGVQTLYHELMADPRCASTVHISMITFADKAYQMDMVPVTAFTPPQLTANGSTSLGGALHALNESLDRDIIPNQPGRKGDYKPLVFLLTDGQPTDQWQPEAQRLNSRTANRALNVIGLAIGDDADEGVLRQICKVVLKLEDQLANAEGLRRFFDWVTNSIKTASQAPGDGQVQLPATPQGIVIER